MVSTSGLWIFLSILSTASTAHVGYFESENCVDPKGMESCYKTAESVKAKCDDSGHRFDEKCLTAFAQDQVTCAATHCWDQVYTCEYQVLVKGLLSYKDKSTLTGIPFYPPPENAASSCNCNYSKIASLSSEIVRSAGGCARSIDNKLKEEVSDACLCCNLSGILSAFPQVCPDHTLTLAYNQQLISSAKDIWRLCGASMAKLPCESKELNFSTPEGISDFKFYKPEDFATLGGTKTLANSPGTITAPISGATFTWTHLGREMPVTAAMADAKSTGDPGEAGGNEDKGNSASCRALPWPGMALLIAAWAIYF